jgi:hypothetical protein
MADVNGDEGASPWQALQAFAAIVATSVSVLEEYSVRG